MSEWTILDSYGTPYGGERDNIAMPVRAGGAGYEAPDLYHWFTYGHDLGIVDWIGRQNCGGPA